MSRKKRIMSGDGLFHVWNHGDYRSAIFESEGAKVAFAICLGEACERFSWQAQAYCMMPNSYHLALDAPRGNLSEGVRWLQGTFAMRFNRYRREIGHLFKSPFKSLVVERGHNLLALVNFIHLNPVIGGMTSVAGLRRYRWTSMSRFPAKERRPSWLDVSWMRYGNGLADTSSGWAAYQRLLDLQAAEDEAAWNRTERAMTRGWCVGSDRFREEIARGLMETEGAIRMEGEELRELNRLQWSMLLERCLATLGKASEDIQIDRKSARWKVAIAAYMKTQSSASNAWISERLCMGTSNAVSAYCGKYLKEHAADCPFAEKLKIEH